MRLDFTITVPEKISLNAIYAGTHWSKRSRLKDLYHWSLKSQLPKDVKFTEKVSFTYIFRWKKNALDASNCSYMIKLLEDAFVKERVIDDDTHKFVSQITTQSVLDKNLPCDSVQIIVEESTL